MPRIQPLKTLKHLTLENILHNFDREWCREEIFEELKKGIRHSLFMLSPFDDLPPHLLSELFHYVKNNISMRRHHLYLLLSPSFTELNYSRCHSELHLVLVLARIRCAKRLKALNLSGITKGIPKIPFKNLLADLTQLTSLDVSQANKINDEYVSMIGSHCPVLRLLNLESTRVSDYGLAQLYKPKGKCDRLRAINVLYTCVTVEGVTAAALHLHDLVELLFQESIEVVSRIKGQFPFKTLYSTSINHDDAMICAFKACPFVENVYMDTYAGMTELAFVPLTSLNSKLKKLQISNLENRSDLFINSALTPVFHCHGSTLTSVTLTDLFEVDLDVIIDNCSTLRTLHLLFNYSYAISTTVFTQPLSTLKNFSLRAFEGNAALIESGSIYPSKEQLKTLISSKSLQNLELGSLDQLDNELFKDFGELLELEVLELNGCNKITMEEGFSDFLYARNNLRHLKLIDCKEITLQDITQYKQHCEKCSWNITTEWT